MPSANTTIDEVGLENNEQKTTDANPKSVEGKMQKIEDAGFIF